VKQFRLSIELDTGDVAFVFHRVGHGPIPA
jgi:hypothetical protein